MPSLEEMHRDLIATIEDRQTCAAIGELIRKFIAGDGTEDRNRFKMDAFRYEGLAVEAANLRIRIEQAIKDASA